MHEDHYSLTGVSIVCVHCTLNVTSCLNWIGMVCDGTSHWHLVAASVPVCQKKTLPRDVSEDILLQRHVLCPMSSIPCPMSYVTVIKVVGPGEGVTAAPTHCFLLNFEGKVRRSSSLSRLAEKSDDRASTNPFSPDFFLDFLFVQIVSCQVLNLVCLVLTVCLALYLDLSYFLFVLS